MVAGLSWVSAAGAYAGAGHGVLRHSEGDNAPITNMKVEVWARKTGFFGGLFGGQERIAKTKTDFEGVFSFNRSFSELVRDRREVEVRLVHKDPEQNYEVQTLGTLKLTPDQKKQLVAANKVGELQLPWCEWDEGALPIRKWYADNDALNPADWSAKYKVGRIAEAGIDRVIFGRLIDLVQRKPEWAERPQGCVDADDLQKVFPSKGTVSEVEEKEPGKTRTASWFMDQLVNGFGAGRTYWLHGDKAGEIVTRTNFDAYTHDGTHDLANISVIAKWGSDMPKMTALVTQLRDRAKPEAIGQGGSLLAPTKTRVSGDRLDETQRQYAAASQFVHQQIRAHLGAHLTVAQFDNAFRRAFHGMKPLTEVFSPMLKGAARILEEGKTLIFGENAAMVASTAFTKESVFDALKDELAGLDWKDYRPRKPLGSGDRFAKVANLYWNDTMDALTDLFNKDDGKLLKYVKANWRAVYNFSEELHRSSVEFKPFQGVTDMSKWVDTNELIDPDKTPRESVDGVPKALSRITTVQENPSDQDVDNFIQALCFMTHMDSLRHEWANDNQLIAAGDVRHTFMGYTPGRDVPLSEMEDQLFLVNLLNGFEQGDFGDDDAPDWLKPYLARNADKYAAAGLPFTDIRYKINI